MSDDEEVSVDDLKKRLLELRKKRRQAEKELEETLDKTYPHLDNIEGMEELEISKAEDKIKYYERMGVKVTMAKSKKDKIFYISYLNWFEGKVVQTYYTNILQTDKSISIFEHNIPKDICTNLKANLPIKTTKEEGKKLLASIYQSVKAFYLRKNQLEELTKKNQTLQVTWSSDCKDVEIRLPLQPSDPNYHLIDTILNFQYNEQSYLPSKQSYALVNQADAAAVDEEELKQKVGDFADEFLAEAFEKAFLNEASD